MNWVGGARSRVKQSQERKIQKEFFERQKLAKRVNVHKKLSPKAKGPVSLDLLSLQTINQTHQGENGIRRKQPVKVVLGDRSNLLPRRQEDLELPMSPIRYPSNLAFLDSKSEKNASKNKTIFPEEVVCTSYQFPVASGGKGKSSQADYASTFPTNRDSELQLPESVTPLKGAWRQLESQTTTWQPVTRLPQPGDTGDQCEPISKKKSLLAFQRAEKKKFMASSKPLVMQPPDHDPWPAYPIKPIHSKRVISTDDESPTSTLVSSKFRLQPQQIHMANEASHDVVNDDLSDSERKVLLGLDYEKGHDLHETVCNIAPMKKIKTSSFEEMVNNYEKSAITNKKPAASAKHEAWRKFTHEKTSINDMFKVPDLSVGPPADSKTSLFFKKQLPKMPLKRPSTVLQELLCLDEDLNNSDLFQTQDFTFEDVIAVGNDFEEPLKQFQHTGKFENQQVVKDDNVQSTHHNPVVPNDAVMVIERHSGEPPVQLPGGRSPDISNSTSVGVQHCIEAGDLCNIATQTEELINSLLKDSSTQTGDLFQLADAETQVTLIQKPVMTQTDESITDDRLGSHHHQPLAQELAVARSTIVWQSVMIKLLKIDANVAS